VGGFLVAEGVAVDSSEQPVSACEWGFGADVCRFLIYWANTRCFGGVFSQATGWLFGMGSSVQGLTIAKNVFASQGAME